jgi:hypothetical protein
MAEEKTAKEPTHISLCRAENGWKISCNYESEKSLSQKAGWVPCSMGECKEYVEKTKDAVLKRLKEVL